MSLALLTEKILSIREKKSEAFAKKNAQLRQWYSKVSSLLEINRHNHWPGIISDSRQETLWETIVNDATNLKESIDVFTQEDGVFTLACNRAQRKYVNIGAVGIMREGKSEFIAAATNLGNWLLPRKNTDHPCTTAPINIVKGDSPDGKSNIARVYYLTVKDIVALFVKYLQELNENTSIITNCNISTRQSLKVWCDNHRIMEFPNEIASEKTQMQITFEKYRMNIGDYVGNLIESDEDPKYRDFEISEIEKGEEEGREYYSSVSYYESPGAVDGSEVYTSFSTKEAQIFTNDFNIVGEDDVNNIQFLDTPGIGEQKVDIDTILSRAITKDRDIVIGIRKIGGEGAGSQLGEKYLFNALRKSMATWPKSKEWIYFILNAFSGATYSKFLSTRDRIIDNLSKVGEDNTSIKLDKSHFDSINLKDNQRLTQDGYVGTNPIGELLTSILETIIPQISSIDADFYQTAEQEYLNIENSFAKLMDSVKQLHLHTYNNLSQAVDAHCDTLCTALTSATPSVKDIGDCLKDDIQIFTGSAEESADVTGTELAKVFNLPKTIAFNDKEALFKQLRKAAEKTFAFAWYHNTEFSEYQFKRKALVESMRDSLSGTIHWEEAISMLTDAKIEVCKTYMEVGKLAKVVSQQEVQPLEWLDMFISMLEDDGNYPNLVEAFTLMRDFTIDPKTELSKEIDEAVQRGYHFDKFEPWNFEEVGNTINAFLESLYNIELATKSQIEEDFAKTKIPAILTRISNVFSPVLNSLVLTEDSQGKKKGTRAEFENFFMAHSEIFVNNDDEIKQSLVEKCKNVTK